MVIDALHLASPLRVARIRLSLVHQHPLDDAILLCLPGQRHQTFIGVIAVSLQHALHPSWRRLHIRFHLVRHETLNPDAADGHMYHTHTDVLRQRLYHRPAKPVGRSQAGIRTTQRSSSLAPLPHPTAALLIVHSRHQQESRAGTLQVLSLRACGTLHVRLSETQEDIEVFIYSGICSHESGNQQHHKKKDTFHVLNI